MFTVCIRDEQGTTRVAELARALGLAQLEARARLRAAEDGPAVAAYFAERAPAEELAPRLAACGVEAWVLDEAAVETDAQRSRVRRFELGADTLVCHLRRDDAGIEVPYASVRLLLRVQTLRRESMVETVRERKLSVTRALASGGLIMTKTETRKRTVTRGEAEQFLLAYRDGGGPLLFHERELDYSGLEAEGARVALDSSSNFQRFVEALRARCLTAVFDERLGDRLRQATILGAGLAPESHLDLAITLLRDAALGR